MIPAFLLGMLICWLVMNPVVKRLESEKEELLDVNEKLLRDKEEMERHESYLALRLFKAEHPELNSQRLSDDEVIYEGDEVEIQ